MDNASNEQLQQSYREELEKLNTVSAAIQQRLEQLSAVPRYYGQDLTEQVLEDTRETLRRNLAAATQEPYFGRLDFQEKGKDAPTPLYIGKRGLDDDRTQELMVIDWRAPVASLFYTFTGGENEAVYDTPDGLIAGLVYLKRNLVIRKQILQRVVDTYERGSNELAVNDEFLLYRLGENKDNRLRDIVSTIQAEQDRIIRSEQNKALVIQGVAGSGKTTVALHRLAFLLYQYREQMRAEKMIIFAPNRMFLDYISGVLPELGVGNIQQTTFEEWALGLLEEPPTLAPPQKELETWFAIGSKRPEIHAETPGVYKGSAAFAELLREAVQAYEAGFAPAADFSPWDGSKLPYSQIRVWFEEEYRHYPVMKRRERVMARINRWIEMQLERFGSTNLRKENKKKATQRFRSFQKLWPNDTPFSFYRSLFAPVADNMNSAVKQSGQNGNRYGIPEAICKQTSSYLKKKTVKLEDLAPLVLIHTLFYGMDGNHFFDHIVIDEAQDFSPFQLELLKQFNRNGSFTILGDLAQSIHTYQGVSSWDGFLDRFEPEHSGYFVLERSYRSTMEIIQFANEILNRSPEHFVPAVPVFRSGDKVKRVQASKADKLDQLAAIIARIQSGTANTVAVIGRTGAECEAIHQDMAARGLDAHLIRAEEQSYGGGLSVLPVYLAKGLEFDAVVLVDTDEYHYPLTALEAKLLYVGCTRALHELWLLYAGKPSPFIDAMDESLVDAIPSIASSEEKQL